MFYVPTSPRAYNLYHHGNYVTEASTVFLRDAKSNAKIVSAIGESIQRVTGIDEQPAFTQSIISGYCEFHQFGDYVVVFRRKDRASWKEIDSSVKSASVFNPGNPPLETNEEGTRKRANA